MPSATEYLQEVKLMRAMALGIAKTKKTWWAGTAAEAGFNVLMLDCDNSSAILRNLSPEALRRIYIVDIQDTTNMAVAAEFCGAFLGRGDAFYREQDKNTYIRPVGGTRHYSRKVLDRNWVCLLDSWTKLTRSIAFKFALQNNIDLTDADKPDWEGYRWCGMLATHLLHQFIALPCHCVLVCHMTQYEKYKGEGRNRKLEWSRKQPISTSGPHGMTLADKFDDVLNFVRDGSNFFIDTRGDDMNDSGSRVFAPNKYKWQDLPFSVYAQAHSVPLPSPELPPPDDTMFPLIEQQATVLSTPSAVNAPASMAARAADVGNLENKPAAEPVSLNTLLGGTKL